MDRNHSAEVSDGPCRSGRVEVLRDRGLGPFPAAQTAGMFPGFWLLTVKGAEE